MNKNVVKKFGKQKRFSMCSYAWPEYTGCDIWSQIYIYMVSYLQCQHTKVLLRILVLAAEFKDDPGIMQCKS